jgi:hypothetical protein
MMMMMSSMNTLFFLCVILVQEPYNLLPILSDVSEETLNEYFNGTVVSIMLMGRVAAPTCSAERSRSCVKVLL